MLLWAAVKMSSLNLLLGPTSWVAVSKISQCFRAHGVTVNSVSINSLTRSRVERQRWDRGGSLVGDLSVGFYVLIALSRSKVKVWLSLCALRHEDVWGSGGKAASFLTSALFPWRRRMWYVLPGQGYHTLYGAMVELWLQRETRNWKKKISFITTSTITILTWSCLRLNPTLCNEKLAFNNIM
jgi:hypothetical protein